MARYAARTGFTAVLLAAGLLTACGEDAVQQTPIPTPDIQSRDTGHVDPPQGKGDRIGGEDAGLEDTGMEDAEGGRDAKNDGPDTRPDPPPAPEYALTPRPYTTLQQVWAPRTPSDATVRAMASGDLEITDIDEYRANALGVKAEPGQPWTIHNELAPGFEKGDPDRRGSVLYFWQSADPQLIDEESPIRFEGVTRAPMGSTYRPQGHLTTQVYESHVRSARRISEASGRPFDFAFVAGDMTDGGQENELLWSFDILGGGVVDPDSGVDDDPVPGPGNDFTDPFYSRGIGVPWYMAIGNHETLYVGTLHANDKIKEAAVGDEVFEFTGKIPGVSDVDGLQNGYRDASTPTGEVVTSGNLPADPQRRILTLRQVLEAIHNADGQPKGHGIRLADAINERGYYSFHPIEGKPLRFIVLNTLSSDPANVRGAIDSKQFEWLKNQLNVAQSRDELVIVGGHHRVEDIALLSPTSRDELEELLSDHPNVLLYLVGHGHKNTKKLVKKDADDRGYWELMAPSTVDFPMQTRIFELVYEGNGYLSVYVTNLGHNAAPGSPAARARHLAAGRKFFGITPGDPVEGWAKQQRSTNLLLRYELPDDLAQSLEDETWPTRIESTETLQKFPVPGK